MFSKSLTPYFRVQVTFRLGLQISYSVECQVEEPKSRFNLDINLKGLVVI